VNRFALDNAEAGNDEKVEAVPSTKIATGAAKVPFLVSIDNISITLNDFYQDFV
jgi:hypothetical protein